MVPRKSACTLNRPSGDSSRPAEGRSAGFQRFDLSRPLASGITYRPLAVTAKDTLDFHLSRNLERQQNLRAGITAEREAELLAAWHSR